MPIINGTHLNGADPRSRFRELVSSWENARLPSLRLMVSPILSLTSDPSDEVTRRVNELCRTFTSPNRPVSIGDPVVVATLHRRLALTPLATADDVVRHYAVLEAILCPDAQRDEEQARLCAERLSNIQLAFRTLRWPQVRMRCQELLNNPFLRLKISSLLHSPPLAVTAPAAETNLPTGRFKEAILAAASHLGEKK